MGEALKCIKDGVGGPLVIILSNCGFSSQILPTSTNLHKSAFYQHISFHIVEDKRTSLWKNIRACFAVGLCPVLLTSAAKPIEVAINYHNCLFWILAIHHPSLCQQIHLAQPLFLTVHKHYEASGSLQKCLCSTKFAVSVTVAFQRKDLIPMGTKCHPSCHLLLGILITLFIVLCDRLIPKCFCVPSAHTAKITLLIVQHFWAKFVSKHFNFFLVFTMIRVRMHEWMPVNISDCLTHVQSHTDHQQRTEPQIYSRQSCSLGQLTRKPAV